MLIGLCAIAPAGCGEAFGPEDVAGFYRLVAVNDLGVPNAVEIQGDTIRIISGWMQLREDGSCNTGIRVDIRASYVGTCSYSMDGQEITIRSDGGGVLAGRADGEALTLTDDNGDRWVFQE